MFLLFLLSYLVLDLKGDYMAPRFVGKDIILFGSKYHGLYLYSPDSKKVLKALDNAYGFHVSFDEGENRMALRTDAGVVVYHLKEEKVVYEGKYQDINGYPVFVGNHLVIPLADRSYVLNENNEVEEELPITFTYATSSGSLLAFQRNDSIFLFDFEKRTLRLLRGGDGRYFMPTISPDGRYVVYSSLGEGLFLHNLESDETFYIGKGGNASWSPDSKKLVFAVVEDNGEDITGADLHIFTVGDKKVEKLTETPSVFELIPSFSPDGKKVIFNTFDGKIGLIELEN